MLHGSDMIHRWLQMHWVTTALCTGIVLLALAPLIRLHASLFVFLIYLHTPVYMVHQVEEHSGDRFRRFVNQHIFHGVEALTPTAVLWINLPGVWGITLASLYAAVSIGSSWGLAAVYLVLVNAGAHLLGAAVTRSYNPGLWTALVLFLPLGFFTLETALRDPAIGWPQHVVGLLVAAGIHAAIVIHTRRRAAHLAPAVASR